MSFFDRDRSIAILKGGRGVLSKQLVPMRSIAEKISSALLFQKD